MKIVNLTPHNLVIIVDGKTVLDMPPSGPMARCAESRSRDGFIDIDGVSVPVDRVGFGAVTDLPAPAPDTIYVVSRFVADAVPTRPDVMYPDQQIRGAGGAIVGCAGLARTT